MDPELRHDEIRELLGAYALDAVDGDEQRQLEKHLAGCPRCRAEVAEHRESAAMLAAGGAPAPVGIWNRIAGALERPIQIERPTRLRAARWLKGVAAAAAASLVVWLATSVIDQRQQLQRLAGSVEESSLARAATAALVDPEARRIRLASPDGSLEAEAVVLPDGTGFVVTDNLRPLPPTRTYQLWALGQADAVSAGVLGPDPALTAFTVSPDLTGLAITEEVAGGVATTDRAPLLVGGLPVA